MKTTFNGEFKTKLRKSNLNSLMTFKLAYFKNSVDFY